ncbi:heat shock factor protein HSF24-like [Impatiens glandulifera]|uniref:heat shock factor protein HSF24-like n=1 Tax=Impatiens glandulifera TaxID=253017 RepID=UPI001FB12AB2|nr:heat shock factor protein HSF24-like [Impatiens glandulifera]
MGPRSAPAPFLTKTYDLVDDPSSDDVVSWNEDGTTFVVWKTADFAKDMLPNFFKHNNFSSFVRQLNTYGFKKIVPDKWEFSNDNFKKGQKHQLIKIRRRKPAAISPPTPAKTPFSITNSGEDQGYTSSSSPDSKNSGSVEPPAGIVTVAAQFAGLTDENEKLKRDNEMLSSELAHVKKQCDELAVYLMDRVNVGPDQINRIMGQLSSCGSSSSSENKKEKEETAAAGDGESTNNVKLFGVWVKSSGGSAGERKRGREETPGTIGVGPRGKEMKKKSHVEFESPWMKISSCSGGVSRVCN